MADVNGKVPVRGDGSYDLINNEPNSGAIILHERVASPDETNQLKRPTAVSSGDDNRHCMDVAMADGDGIGIDKDNPMPVYLTDSPATEIEDYDVQSLTKSGGTGDHDYLTTSEFRGLNAEGSSAGLAKFELKVETAPASGTYNTIMVKFNSVGNPNVTFEHKFPKPIVSGVNIRITKTNLDNNDTDVYSLINGTEV